MKDPGLNWKERVWATLAGSVVVVLIVGFVWLDYAAYRQRFPQAEPWTYVFHR